ncbi:Por secretion system C-terminal sorting domain-containing protein, partial [Salinimicrobium catena]
GGTWSGMYVSASGLFDADGLAADDYTVTYTYSDGNGCENSDTAVVTVHPTPEFSYVMPPLDCFAEAGSIGITSNTEGLEFRIDDGPWFTYTGTIDVAPGPHTIMARDAVTLCVSDEEDFIIPPLLDSPLTPTLDAVQPTCETLTGTILVTSRTEGLEFAVVLSTDLNGEIPDESYLPYPSGGFSGLAPGQYAVFAMSADGCQSGMATISLIEPECPEFEGCTLGYWKNHTDRWCDAYQTCTEYDEVFGTEENPVPDELSGLTLLEVLNLGGGGIYNLGRQSVAALLNACTEQVYFELETTDDVIAYVNDNFGNASDAGAYLDMLNNAGCTMGGSRATSAPSDGCDDEASNGNGNGNNGRGNDKPNPGKGKKADNSEINTFPVPFKETVNIQYDFDYTSDVTIEIFNMRGNHLRTYTDRNVTKGSVTQLQVDFAMKANQMYILKVKTDRETFVEQIVSSKK